MALTDDQVTAGQIFERLGALIRDNGVPVVGWVVALSAIDIAMEQLALQGVSTFLSSIVSVVAQYYLVTAALGRLGLRQPGIGQFGSFFGLGILSGLGILLGFLLLIIPGVYLATRWSVASAVLLAERKGASDALSESWAMTQRSFWAILGTYLVILLPASIVGIALSVAFAPTWPLPSSVIGSLFMNGAFVVSWLIGIAVYSLLRPGQDPLVEIFA